MGDGLLYVLYEIIEGKWSVSQPEKQDYRCYIIVSFIESNSQRLNNKSRSKHKNKHKKQ